MQVGIPIESVPNKTLDELCRVFMRDGHGTGTLHVAHATKVKKPKKFTRLAWELRHGKQRLTPCDPEVCALIESGEVSPVRIELRRGGCKVVLASKREVNKLEACGFSVHPGAVQRAMKIARQLD